MSSVVTVIETSTETAVFLAISNPTETAVLGSLLMVSFFLILEQNSSIEP